MFYMTNRCLRLLLHHFFFNDINGADNERISFFNKSFTSPLSYQKNTMYSYKLLKYRVLMNEIVFLSLQKE